MPPKAPVRKQWGQPQQAPVKEFKLAESSSSDEIQDLKTVKEFEEESYSDSFEEVNNTVLTVRKRDVTNLLMTATAEQLDVLKQSLSNFKDLSKKPADENGDEYIEEIFEDQAEEDGGTDLNASIRELTEQEMIKMREDDER